MQPLDTSPFQYLSLGTKRGFQVLSYLTFLLIKHPYFYLL